MGEINEFSQVSKTKSDLLRAALSEFALNGYTKASLSHIAQKADVSKGAIYWHFKNKVDLFSQLLMHESTIYDQHLQAKIVDLKSSIEILKTIFFQSSFYFIQHREFCKILFQAMSQNNEKNHEKIQSYLHDTESKYYSFLYQIVKKGVMEDELCINEPHHVVVSFGILIDGIMMQIILNQPESEIRKGMGFSWKVFEKGIRNIDYFAK